MADQIKSQWNIGKLELKPKLVWTMAISSLRIRISRTVLTILTISTCSAFLIYLMTLAKKDDPTEIQSWYLMIFLSLIVSVAGVLNTMLMSVTQRYREIGTIKCLGALDSFVLYSVLLESALVGLIGAVLGIIFGFLIAIVIGAIEFGSGVFTALDFDHIAFKIFITFVIGMTLTTVGAAIPAWIAAKMPPMDAMRGEK